MIRQPADKAMVTDACLMAQESRTAPLPFRIRRARSARRLFCRLGGV